MQFENFIFWMKAFNSNMGVMLIVFILLTIVLMLISIAYYTLAERKIMASIQRRKGPNIVGWWGLLQPLADGLKLVFKQKIIPRFSNFYLFSFAPFLILTISLTSWLFISLNTPTFGENPFVILWDLILSVDLQPWVFNKYKCCETISLFFYDKTFDSFNKISSLLTPYMYISHVGISKLAVNILLILAISSLNVYGIILAGWSSNSKYAFLGALRSAAQMISYEVSIGLTILPVILVTGSTLNLNDIIIKYFLLQQQWILWFLFPCFIIFLISMLAETNRTPFDLTEAEAELVAGYNVEYSSITFAMFFLAEYANMLLMSCLITIFFFGAVSIFGWILEVEIFIFLFVLIRATFPRYKYNELMDLGWKTFLPVSLAFLIYCSCLLFFSNSQLLTLWYVI